MTHSPTPWKLEDDNTCTNILSFEEKKIIWGAQGEGYCFNHDAEIIVKAVNAWNNPKALRARLIEMGW